MSLGVVVYAVLALGAALLIAPALLAWRVWRRHGVVPALLIAVTLYVAPPIVAWSVTVGQQGSAFNSIIWWFSLSLGLSIGVVIHLVLARYGRRER